jgi:hypothetical protein
MEEPNFALDKWPITCLNRQGIIIDVDDVTSPTPDADLDMQLHLLKTGMVFLMSIGLNGLAVRK